MNRSVTVRAFSAAYCLLILCCLSACAIGGRNRADGSFTDNRSFKSAYDKANEPTKTEGVRENPIPEDFQETTAEPEDFRETVTEPEDFQETTAEPEDFQEMTAKAEESGKFLSVEDIDLHAVDETGRSYVFSYNQEEFSARYTPDNWKIVDSYKITDTDDIILICQALLDAHPVHGRDMESFRTAEDMAFEWLQHNIAYEILPDDSPWKRSAKDVDLNPADQGRTFLEIYEDRTGKKFSMEDLLSRLGG